MKPMKRESLFTLLLFSLVMASCGGNVPISGTTPGLSAPTEIPISLTSTPSVNDQLRNATVVTTDSLTLEVTNLQILGDRYPGYMVINHPTYEEIEGLFIYTDLTSIIVPLETIQTITISEVDSHYLAIEALLIDGTKIEGDLQSNRYYEYLGERICGKSTIQGYSADYCEEFQNIILVAFNYDIPGIIMAEVTDQSGVTVQVTEPWFEGDTAPESMESVSAISIQTGDFTLEIPFADILEMTNTSRYEHETAFNLAVRDGEEIEGQIAHNYWLKGNTTVYGLPGIFCTPLFEIDSVTFHQ